MGGAKKSAKVLFLGSLFSKGITFIGTIVLARLLYPNDFGYLVSAMVITGFIQMLGNIGFENYYLQEKIVEKKDEKVILDITYKLRLFVNVILFVIQVLLSYVIELYWNQEVLAQMIRIFALSMPIMALIQVDIYILRKHLDYRPEVYANLARDIVGTSLKIIFAWVGLGALAFAIGAVIGNIARFFVIRYFQHYRVSWLTWDKKVFEKIYFFGKHSFLTGIGTFFTQQIDKILLSFFYPSSQVGHYYFGSSQAQSIFTYTIAPQASLVLSYSARYKDKPQELFNILSKLAYLIGITLLPVTFFLTVYADVIFSMVFSDKWKESIYVFQLFLVYFFITELTFPVSGLIMAYGVPHIGSKLVFLRLIILTIGLITVTFCCRQLDYYMYIFLMISFIFSWLKAKIGLALMGYSLYDYLYQLKEILIIFPLFWGVYELTKYIIDDKYIQMAFVLCLFVFLNIFIHGWLYRKKFFNVLKLVFGHHSLLQRLQTK